jgi:hypothetical protein
LDDTATACSAPIETLASVSPAEGINQPNPYLNVRPLLSQLFSAI